MEVERRKVTNSEEIQRYNHDVETIDIFSVMDSETGGLDDEVDVPNDPLVEICCRLARCQPILLEYVMFCVQ